MSELQRLREENERLKAAILKAQERAAAQLGKQLTTDGRAHWLSYAIAVNHIREWSGVHRVA